MSWTEAGTCPKCEDEWLIYEPSETIDETIIYPYTCKKCGFKGREVYYVEFVEHEDENGNAV